ncbi:hypothetical protein [Sphingomonas sp. ACRSK]|nr:hypothetical protein [Sphingomonas sp. ACRSK]
MFDNFERAFKALMIVSVAGAITMIGLVVYVGVAIARYLGSH